MLWMALDGPGETGWTNSRRNCAGKGEAMSGRGHVARKQTSQGVRYYPVIELPHDPATGKRRQRWHPAHTSRRAADRELVRLLGQLDRGAYVEPNRLTVRAYLEVWLAGMAGKVEPNTLEVWTVYARAHVDPAIGHVLLQQLTATGLAAFYTGLADHGRPAGEGPPGRAARVGARGAAPLPGGACGRPACGAVAAGLHDRAAPVRAARPSLGCAG